MIRPIYLYGSAVLRQKAVPADTDTQKEHISELVSDLWETLAASEGCGLAAPQIGVSERVLVVDGDVMTDVYDYLAGFKRTMINPEIISESETRCTYNEGCLSVPGIYADVTRPSCITVRYLDEKFEEITETFDRFAARMIQHELSHLDGVVFTDLVAPIRKKMISKKLLSITQGRVHPHYNSKLTR